MDTLLSDALAILIKLTWAVGGFFSGNSLISWQNLFIPTLIAITIGHYIKKYPLRDMLGWLFPKHIWSQPSARIDLQWYIIVMPLSIFAIAPLLAVLQVLSYDGVLLLESVFGPRLTNPDTPNGIAQILLYTFCIFLARDFAFFYSHYLSHKWPLLWCFHKVHHSPPALTPFTALRFHPVDLLWNMGAATLCVLLVSSLCQYLFYNGEETLTLFGNNLFIALSYFTTHILRHSHIELRYPNWLDSWLISPARHQIHHSAERHHWDKNFGYLFNGWDRLWGTSYRPRKDETYRQGVLQEDGSLYNGHDSIKQLLWRPFREAWAVIKP